MRTIGTRQAMDLGLGTLARRGALAGLALALALALAAGCETDEAAGPGGGADVQEDVGAAEDDDVTAGQPDGGEQECTPETMCYVDQFCQTEYRCGEGNTVEVAREEGCEGYCGTSCCSGVVCAYETLETCGAGEVCRETPRQTEEGPDVLAECVPAT